MYVKGSCLFFVFVSFYPYVKILTVIIFVVNLASESYSEIDFSKADESSTVSYGKNFHRSGNSYTLRISKRNFPQATKCIKNENCSSYLPGSLCLNGNCTCPQGFLPNAEGSLGCFQVGKNIGDPCNVSAQCGEDLFCQKNVCTCPDGFQFFQALGANMCLFWHRPTRLIDRCVNIEDCLPVDPNFVCKKRWCQCNKGYQLFETMLFGLKHKCFKTHKKQCLNSSQCSKLIEASDQFCICEFGYCHCIKNNNFSMLDNYGLINDKPNWYQRWKKDLILATRLLFITVILFFVPCFVYVTLGVRQRSRQFFSHAIQPSRNVSRVNRYPARRGSYVGSQRSDQGEGRRNSELHNVELALSSRGVNSRIIIDMQNASFRDVVNGSESRCVRGSNVSYQKEEEDPPPSYEEIMSSEPVQDVPPPPYREL